MTKINVNLIWIEEWLLRRKVTCYEFIVFNIEIDLVTNRYNLKTNNKFI